MILACDRVWGWRPPKDSPEAQQMVTRCWWDFVLPEWGTENEHGVRLFAIMEREVGASDRLGWDEQKEGGT